MAGQVINMNEAEFIKLIIDLLPAIITIGLSILSVVLGKKYKAFKKSFIAVIALLDAINLAIADDDITFEEIQVIIKRINELQSKD